MPLSPGEPAPWFRSATPSHPEFTFESVAGRFILLAFLPSEPAARAEALKALARHRRLFDDRRLSAFAVVRDGATAAAAKDLQGLRWILDESGAVSRQFGALDEAGVEQPFWLVLDPTLRVLAAYGMADTARLFGTLPALPQPADHAGVPLHAPVLISPRVFEPAFCAQLIAYYDARDAAFSGVMKDAGERTVAVMDELKRRRDVLIEDEPLLTEVRERLETRLFPHIKRALGFTANHIERFLISCYDAGDQAVFRAHRDNTTRGTAHRKFAGSINLNDDFEGGDLRLAEFGPATYRPPVGGAAVFSCSLLHEVTPVTRGRRYAFLPFFYDEAGAKVREAYRAAAVTPTS